MLWYSSYWFIAGFLINPVQRVSVGLYKLLSAASLWQGAPHLQEGNNCHGTSL